VNGIGTSRIPRPGYLVPLGPNGRFPYSVGVAGPQGPPGASGLVLVSADTAADGSTPKATRAVCPTGKKILGGGTELTANAGGAPLAVQDSHPLTDGTGWYASAARVGTFSQSWALRVWAVCATVS
jgi:hypothetical protein